MTKQNIVIPTTNYSIKEVKDKPDYQETEIKLTQGNVVEQQGYLLTLEQGVTPFHYYIQNYLEKESINEVEEHLYVVGVDASRKNIYFYRCHTGKLSEFPKEKVSEIAHFLLANNCHYYYLSTNIFEKDLLSLDDETKLENYAYQKASNMISYNIKLWLGIGLVTHYLVQKENRHNVLYLNYNGDISQPSGLRHRSHNLTINKSYVVTTVCIEDVI